MNGKHQKALLWTGMVLANLYGFGFVKMLEFWPLPAPTMDATQVLELYTRHLIQFRFGVIVMCLSSLFWMLWTVVICAQMYRLEKGFPIWTVMQGLMGALQTWLFALPPIIWGITAYLVERNPELTLLMHQAGFLSFIAPPGFILLQFIAISVVSLSKNNKEPYSALPRWMGWLTLWISVLASAGAMAFVFKTGPFAWNGLLSFYMPVFVFAVWIVPFFYCTLRAINHQQRTETP